MKNRHIIFAAALAASAGLATATSAAEGEYYRGAGATARTPGVDFLRNRSINPILPRLMTDTKTIDSGDYSDGVDRNRQDQLQAGGGASGA
ncbi:vancomycin resistance protein YoaR [Pseudorhizobium tarimense]|uniref:Vancomycin resistance protein YoaR n=1 Tax=Pseudorhizobium tarimense TaxID=1079109 RepID=A0ABV2H8R2_9HYPH|nr:hypothetical protein [Pseudorhizobium tarimense]MCJ8519985.1 hypothetical protein [Pseudorhizobium tarimense]